MATERTLRKLPLIVEKGDGELWGRVTVKGNLIVDSAKNLEALQKQFKALILEQEEVAVGEFEISFDLTSFFKQYPFVPEVANRAGISAGMMRQYASGIKFPSADRVKLIEQAVHAIGKELMKVRLHKPQKGLAV